MARFAICCVLASVLLSVAACTGVDDTADEPNVTSTSETPMASTTGDVSATTSPQPDFSDPGHLLVVGDWGSGTRPQGAVAGAMLRYAGDHDVTAILTTGDNFYSDDREFLMEPFQWAEEANIPFWITWGNHDIESDSRIDAMNQAFDDPPKWALYQWGQIDVIILDSNQITSTEQGLFFLNTMETSSRPTIVAMHHPPYSCAHRGSTTDLVDQVVEILDDDVFLVLSGHEHVYQRFERDGVSYVVTGGGGSTVYELSECPASHPEPIAGAPLHHFVTLERTDAAIAVSAIDVNGTVIDEFEIELP